MSLDVSARKVLARVTVQMLGHGLQIPCAFCSGRCDYTLPVEVLKVECYLGVPGRTKPIDVERSLIFRIQELQAPYPVYVPQGLNFTVEIDNEGLTDLEQQVMQAEQKPGLGSTAKPIAITPHSILIKYDLTNNLNIDER